MKQAYESCSQHKNGCFLKCNKDCNLKNIAAENERKHQEWLDSRKDYSKECTHNDDNDLLCWQCSNFVFPIGCMLGDEYYYELDNYNA